MILMRTATNVLAVDFQTGKRIWQTDGPKEDPAEYAFQPLQWHVDGGGTT